MEDQIKIGYNKYSEEVRAERLAFARKQFVPLVPSVAHTAYIGPEVEIGVGCEIRHHVIIIGKVKIGDHCLIRTGAIIGEDGFSVEKDVVKKEIIRVSHHGGVVIGNHVDIGASAMVNRGTLEDTQIGDYSKISHRVTIGHNSIVGKRVIVNLGSALAGTVTLCDDSFIGFKSTIKGKTRIGVQSVVGMGSLVLEDVPDRAVVVGRPAKILRYI